MTALTLTDDGPHVSTQMGAVPLSEAQDSIQSVFSSSIQRPLASPPREVSRSSVPRMAAYALPTKPMDNTANRVPDILSSIESDIHAVATSLDFSDEYALPAEVALRQLLDSAAEDVTKLGRSLSAITSKALAITNHKTRLRTQLREIDGRVTLLGTTHLSLRNNTEPLIYDAGTCSLVLISRLRLFAHSPC